MKKIILLVILVIGCALIQAMDLYTDDFDAFDVFKNLSLEDQYTSYIETFRHVKDPRYRPVPWARLLVEQNGRDILPFIEKDLESSNLNFVYRKPYDRILGLIAYILNDLDDVNLLTIEDKNKYCLIYEEKIEEYVEENKVIDGTIRFAMGCITVFGTVPDYLFGNSKSIKEYYEKKLGITGIIAGDLNSMWEY